jgi:hypothetical protein
MTVENWNNILMVCLANADNYLNQIAYSIFFIGWVNFFFLININN